MGVVISILKILGIILLVILAVLILALLAVSYTHLDVYKRQLLNRKKGNEEPLPDINWKFTTGHYKKGAK